MVVRATDGRHAVSPAGKQGAECRHTGKQAESRQGDMKWRYRAIHASIILFNIVCLQWMNWFVSHDHCASLRSFDDYFKLDYITLQNGYDDGACHGCDLSWGCSDGNNGGVSMTTSCLFCATVLVQQRQSGSKCGCRESRWKMFSTGEKKLHF